MALMTPPDEAPGMRRLKRQLRGGDAWHAAAQPNVLHIAGRFSVMKRSFTSRSLCICPIVAATLNSSSDFRSFMTSSSGRRHSREEQACTVTYHAAVLSQHRLTFS